MYSDILDKIIVSKDMRNHLKNGGLDNSVDYIEEIIYNASISIDEKLNLLERVGEEVYQNSKYTILDTDDEKTRKWKKWCHDYRVENYEAYCTTIKKAHELQKEEGVFVIESHQYDPGNERIKTTSNFETLCGSFDDVIEWIQNDIKNGEYTEDDLVWYNAGLWMRDEKGKYDLICDYEFLNGMVSFVNLGNTYAKVNGLNTIWGYDREINLEVPFMPGDIIEVNPAPYAPKYRALIMKLEDNRDCCSVRVMTLHPDGKYNFGGLKHNQVALKTFPYISPLYTAAKYDGLLDKSEEIFVKLSAYINGDEEKGKDIWEACVLEKDKIEDLISTLS